MRTHNVLAAQECTHFAVGATIMVDEGGWTKPELCAILTTRIHDTKVVNARFKQCSLLLGRQLADATNQHRDLLILPPAISKCASTKSTTKYRTITTRKLQFY